MYIFSIYTKIWNEWFLNRKNLLSKKNNLQFITNSLPFVMLGVVLIIVAYNIYEGKMNIGDFTLYASQLEQMNASVISLILAISAIYNNRLRVNNIIDLNSVTSEINDGNITLDEDFKDLEFRNVSFTYPNGGRVLDCINFRIKSGDKIALVGHNGAGKTTIIKLLLRFYDPNEGEIFLNGRNIKEYTKKSLREKFSVFFQQSGNYAFNIEDNIILSDLKKGKQKDIFYKAVTKSGIYNLIEKKRLSIKTNVTKLFDSKGVLLSAGENQMLSLARTLYRDREVMLLDEPSSCLDPQAEKQFFEAILNEEKNKTILFIVHRFSNVKFATKILVISEGKIIEEGRHEELLRERGMYFKLFTCQI